MDDSPAIGFPDRVLNTCGFQIERMVEVLTWRGLATYYILFFFICRDAVSPSLA